MLGKFHGEGHGNPLQYSCLKNPIEEPGALQSMGLQSIGKKERKKVKSLSHVPVFATTWTVAYQAPLSMGFSRQEYWSGLPFLLLGTIPNPGTEPGSPVMWLLPSEPPRKSKKVLESTEQLSTLREEMITFTCPWKTQSQFLL